MKKCCKMLAMGLLVVAVLLGGVTGCSKQTDSSGKPTDASYLNTESQFPIVKEPITLKIMAKGGDGTKDYNELYVFKEYEKMTNIKIDWIMVPSSGASETINLTFASNNLPDVYFKCELSSNRQIRYGEEGQLINLMENGLLEKYAPNFWAFMQQYPDVRASQTFPNGAIYSIPAAATDPATRINTKVFVNTDWLKAVNKTFPKTTDELYELLKAFRDGDPNGNGKTDEIPFSAPFSSVLQLFKGFFGLQNRGTHHQDIDMDEKTQKLRLIATTDEYRSMLEYLKKLYSEKLIDQEMFTASTLDSAALVNQNKSGMYIFTNLGLVSAEMSEKMVGIEPITGPFGDSLWAGVRSNLHSTGAFAISKACKYPEAALRWVDYFYCDEGVLFYHYGKVGETCVKNEDGTYSYTEEILSQIKGTTTFDEIVSNYTPYGGGNNPTIMKAPYFSGAELAPKAVEAAEKVKNHIPKEVWPFFNFTIDENLTYDVIMKDINSYVLQRSGEFVAGKVELNDKNWNEFKQTIENMGASQALELATVAYNRAMEIMKGN